MTKAVLLKMSDVKSGTIANVGPISSERTIPRDPCSILVYQRYNFMFTKSIAVELPFLLVDHQNKV
ncbi:MAG: hypothetical protein ACRBBZ_00585 [Nitrosopumilus sp.]